jgi:hypothetical protein
VVGGAIYNHGGQMVLHYNRIVNNTPSARASGGEVWQQQSTTPPGAIDATDNWWGINTDPSSFVAGSPANPTTGQVAAPLPTVSPWIVLKTTASPNPIQEGQSTTLTANFLKDSSGGSLTTSQISTLIGLPVAWANAVHGTLSNQQTTIQSNGTATATLTQDGTCNSSSGEAEVDNVPNGDTTATGTVTVDCPDLTATKTNNVSGTTQLANGATCPPQCWTWTVTVANTDKGYAKFTNGQTILTDNLPNNNISYGAVTVTPNTGVSGTITCTVNGTDDLACTASGAVQINGSDNTPAGSFTASFSATPSAIATYSNPRSGTGNECKVDPNNNVSESNESNNTCSNSVNVTAPDLTVATSNNVSGATTLGNNWTWTLHVANSSTAATATFTNGQTILTDTLPASNLTYGSPGTGNGTNITNLGNVSCSITSNTLTCTATGTVTIGTSGSFDVTFTTTPSATGPYTNPPSSGTCSVDPNTNVPETDETNNSCNADTVTVYAPPAVTSQPSDQTVTAGQTASFSAAASGYPAPTVQWQLSTDNGTSWSNISGATSTTFSFTAQPADNGHQFRAVFTNNFSGSDHIATSNAATLTVHYPPSVTTQPSNQTVTAGQTASFTAAASGNPAPTVQWQISTDGGSTWNNVSGATSTTLSFTAQSSDDGNQYRAVFTNTFDSSDHTATSNAATLTVNVPPSVTAQPTDQTVDAGGNASFSGAASGNPAPTAQWQVSTDGGTTFTDISNGGVYSGATTGTLTLTGVTSSMDGDQYRAVFTNSTGHDTTSAATLTVHYAPAVTTNPTNQTTSAGGNASFSAAANGDPAPSVQWQVSTDSGTTWGDVTDGGVYSSATTATLSITGATSDMNADEYRAVFINTLGTDTSTAAVLTVQFAPSVSTQPQDQTVADGTTANFTTAASGNPSPSVQWQVSTNNGTSWSNISGANNTTYSFTAQSSDDGSQYRAVFTNTFGGGDHTATSDAATLTVDSTPSVTTQPTDQTVTEGGTASFTAAASGKPTPSIQWQVSTDGGTTWSDLSNGTDVSGATTGTLTLTNVARSMSGNQYQAVFTNTFNSSDHTATSNAATLTVDYAPSVTTQPTDQTVDAGQTASFTAAADGRPAPSVQWQVSTDGGTSWSNLSNGTDVSGATTGTLTLTNVATGLDGNQYQAVFTNSVDSATSNAVSLTVHYAPSVGTQPSDQTVDAGANASFSAAASGDPVPTIQWQVSTDGGNTWSNISGATGGTLNVTATIARDGNQYRATFTNTFDGSDHAATTNAATLTVHYAPSITAQPQDQTVHIGDNAQFSAAAVSDPGPPSVQWQVSSDGGSTWTNLSDGSGVSGSTTTTLSLTSVSASMNGNRYQAVFTNTFDSTTHSTASNAATLHVGQPTTTALVSSVNPSKLNQSVTFTATVSSTSSGTITGAVEFSSDGTDIAGCASRPVSGGIATCTTSALAVGTHAVHASYGGDSHFQGSGNAVSQTVTYGVKLLYTATQAFKGGGNIALTLQLVDAAGHNMSASGITLNVTGVTPLPSGVTAPSGTFTYNAKLGGTGGYKYTFSTAGYPKGSYNLTFVVGSGSPFAQTDPVTHQASFQLK